MSDERLDVNSLAVEIAKRVEALPKANVPSVRAVRREYSKRIKGAEPREVVELTKELYRQRRVHRFFGDELIAYHKGALETLSARAIESLGKGMDSWDQVDCFGGYLSGPAWREGVIDDETVHRAVHRVESFAAIIQAVRQGKRQAAYPDPAVEQRCVGEMIKLAERLNVADEIPATRGAP